MGLEITAYSNIVPSGNQSPSDDEIENSRTLFSPYKNPGFPQHAADMPAAYYDRNGDSYRFHAGSYGTYNGWRNDLARMAGYEATNVVRYGRTMQRHDVTVWNNPTGPFAELICFSDCEGVIGPEFSVKLAADFNEFQDKADAFAGENPDWFRECYAHWRKAFTLAAQGGCVHFR